MKGLPPDWWKHEKYRKIAPKDYFLDPENRRYPYKTHTGEVSCERLNAAKILARLRKEYKILKKALEIEEKHCRGKE